MLRIILEYHECDFNSGMDIRDYITMDLDIPELEAALKRGGRGEMGFKITRLLGVEVSPQTIVTKTGA
jgi:hypothetical protein